jgi:hypothetical protein
MDEDGTALLLAMSSGNRTHQENEMNYVLRERIVWRHCGDNQLSDTYVIHTLLQTFHVLDKDLHLFIG